MDPTSLLLFALAYLAVVILPGPGITALVARVLARGTAGAPAYIAGLATGSLLWFLVAATGLAAIAARFSGLFLAIRYAGAAYLLYLAWTLWTSAGRAAAVTDTVPGRSWCLFLTGLATNLGNPKAVVFFLALLPTVVPVAALTPLGITELAGVILLTVSGVSAGYVLAAARVRGLFASPRALRLVHRGSGLAMAGAAATVAAK